MKPGYIYRITYQPFPASDAISEVVDILDNDNLIDDSEDEIITDLPPGGHPVRCSVVDNNEDPFTVIKAQRLIARFRSDTGLGMNTFSSGSDNRWSVHNYIGAKTLFKGFLVLDDLSEDFMPDPNEVILTATDGLGLLKELPLVDFEDENPVGEYTIAELIAMCLRQTGLDLQIKVAFNIKLSGLIDDISIPNSNGQHFFNTVYLDAKTFEDEIGTSIDCYSVLERILGEEAGVFQRQGAWWIMRIDEVEHPTRGLYITTFTSEGIFEENLGEISFEKTVLKPEPTIPSTIFFSRELTDVLPTRPCKKVRLECGYEFAKEIVPNIDFERGALTTTVSPSDKHYATENWTPFFSNTSTDDAPTTDIYIRRVFESDYEKERYIVIRQKAGDFNFILSEPIQVGVKDKFTIGVERRLNSDIGGTGSYIDRSVQVRLYGNDGTFWTHQARTSSSEEKKWVACNSAFRTNQKYFTIEGDVTNDLTEAANLYDGESAEIPVSGYLRIVLGASEQFGDTNDTYYSGLSFAYKPFINGSYLKYTSQVQEVTQDGSNKAKREKQVYISDLPKRAIKGALLQALLYVDVFSGSVQFFASFSTLQISGYQLGKFRKGQQLLISNTTSNNITMRVLAVSYSLIGNITVIEIDQTLVNETDGSTLIQELTFELANQFYNAAVFPDGPPDDTYLHPYSEIQVYDVYNQFKNEKRIFQATLQGMDLVEEDSETAANNAHLIHKWSFLDYSPHTVDRFFILLTFDQNHRDQEWTGTFREVFDLNVDKSYIGRVFRYIS